jgi:hypothetical protein
MRDAVPVARETSNLPAKVGFTRLARSENQLVLKNCNNFPDSVENPFNREMTTGCVFGVIVWMGITDLWSPWMGAGESVPKTI